MYTRLFNDFMMSRDTLQIYASNSLVFASDKARLLPLLEYTDKFSPHNQQVMVFDRIMGNAAALLCTRINCQEICSPLGSELAVKTLDKYGIRYYLTRIVPYIINTDEKDICPMEKLSVGKNPAEFYEILVRSDSRNGRDSQP